MVQFAGVECRVIIFLFESSELAFTLDIELVNADFAEVVDAVVEVFDVRLVETSKRFWLLLSQRIHRCGGDILVVDSEG